MQDDRVCIDQCRERQPIDYILLQQPLAEKFIGKDDSEIKYVYHNDIEYAIVYTDGSLLDPSSP